MGDNRYPGDTQFAGLVEAATAAADQEIHWSTSAEAMNTDVRPEYEAYESRAPEDSYNSVPTGQYNGSMATNLAGPSTRKRKRGIEISREDRTAADELLPDRHKAVSDAPRPSVAATSAAAIFRSPSATSKKYTRPPIGKLYSSLQLSPEDFVELQTTAKAYMLDKNHPERLDTIGQRGRGDTASVKLKLWNFVKEFLDDLGNGQKFFGDHVADVEGQGPRTMIWPQDAEQIIKACIPVMRRMVTNERQRQYAMQARKTTEDAHGHDSGRTCRVTAASANKAARPPELSRADIQGLEIIDLLNDGCVPGAYEAADWYSEHEGPLGMCTQLSSLQLAERDYRVLVANVDGHYRVFNKPPATEMADPSGAVKRSEKRSSEDLVLHVNLVSTEASATSNPSFHSAKRLADPFLLSAVSAPNLQELQSHLQRHFGKPLEQLASSDAGGASPNGKADRVAPELAVKVWLPDGLVRVRDDGDWMVAQHN